jgi:hypothetical protein
VFRRETCYFKLKKLPVFLVTKKKLLQDFFKNKKGFVSKGIGF